MEEIVKDYVLHIRKSPDDGWRELSPEALTQKYLRAKREAAEHHVRLTAYRRWLWGSICINIVLLLVVASTFGGR